MFVSLWKPLRRSSRWSLSTTVACLAVDFAPVALPDSQLGSDKTSQYLDRAWQEL